MIGRIGAASPPPLTPAKAKIQGFSTAKYTKDTKKGPR